MRSEKKSKIIFLVPYPLGIAPGQRFRYEQYINYLKDQEFDIRIFSFLSEKTNRILYTKGNTVKKVIGILYGFLKRAFHLIYVIPADAIFIFRETSPVGPGIFEFIIAKILRKKIIYDFDDAIWVHDVSEANKLWGWLKNVKKIPFIIKESHTVVAGNQYLASYAATLNKNVRIIPTTIDFDYHKINDFSKKKSNQLTIGWTGSSTTNKHLQVAFPILRELKNKYGDKIRFLMISNSEVQNSPVEIEFCGWSKSNEISDLSKIDIGIMPLPDDEWSKGKCGFKGLQYMSLSIPTVMSPVGVNTEIIQDGINGFLAGKEEEWIAKLSLLIENPELRQQLGKAGKKTIIEKFSVESQKENYLKILKDITHS